MTSASIDNISANPLKGISQQEHQSSSYNTNGPLKLLTQQRSYAPINTWADFWYHDVGVNVIPADTKNKRTYVKWSEWQDKPIPDEIHQKWKDTNSYSDGIALIPGKVWRGPNNGKFLVFVDLDNQKAIEEVCNSFNCNTLEKLAEHIIVEQHEDNKNKSHLYFYSDHIFTKKSSDAVKLKDGITNNDVPAIEVKGLGEHGIAYCSPSFHKDGQKYEIIGTMMPKTCGKKVEDCLFQIYKNYNLSINNEGRVPITELFDKDYKIYEGHNRHLALLRTMESLIQRNTHILPIKQIKDIARKWNNNQCVPPLDDKEFEKQWTCALNFIKKSDSNPSAVASPNRYITKKINDTPEVFYYADRIDKKIGTYSIGIKKDDETGEIVKKKIFSNIIIDAIPKKITIYKDNPLLQKSLEKTKILFETSSGEEYEIGPYESNEFIIKELENKKLILNKRKDDEALSCIINAYKENKMVEYEDGLTTYGYYLLNGNIKIVGNLQNITSEFNKGKVKQVINLLNFLANDGWKNKNIFPTVLKWGLVAPFSFSIKFNSDCWLQWLQLYGCGQTGKTTLGYIVLSIWNLDKRGKSIGYGDIDTPARFGLAVSKDTYPGLVNEVGALSANVYGKQTPITELIKHSVENITCRSKFIDGKFHQEILALSPMILTSNFAPPSDGAHNRRFISIHFTEEEKKEPDIQQEFKTQFESTKKSLSVLGDFAASHIQDNPTILLNKDWNNVAVEILEKFWQLIDAPAPLWIHSLEEQKDAIEESSDKTMFDLRAFF